MKSFLNFQKIMQTPYIFHLELIIQSLKELRDKSLVVSYQIISFTYMSSRLMLSS